MPAGAETGKYPGVGPDGSFSNTIMTKTYTSIRSGFSIHRAPRMIQVLGPNGQPAMQALPTNPIEFVRGKYVTSDPDTIAFLESHNAFGKDFHALPTEKELQAKKDEARQAEIARARALLAEAEGEPKGENPNDAPPPDNETEDEANDALKEISGVSSKIEALEALKEAGANMDFAGPRTKNAEVVAEARKQGFVFVGWPA